jgi:hypothetical protein
LVLDEGVVVVVVVAVEVGDWKEVVVVVAMFDVGFELDEEDEELVVDVGTFWPALAEVIELVVVRELELDILLVGNVSSAAL